MSKEKDAASDVRPGTKMLIDAAHTIEERGKVYGHPLPNHLRIARFFQACLAEKLKPGAVISPDDVIRMMIGVKLARLIETPNHADSLMDIAGYSACHLEVTCE